MNIHSMMAKVSKWGNSLGLRIPKAAAQEVGLSDGAEVDISAAEGALLVRPVARRAYRLKSLLQGISASNLHGEEDFGPAVGGELL